MAKLSEKLDVALILFENGYSVDEIMLITKFKQKKQIITHIRKNKTESKSDGKIEPSKINVEKSKLLYDLGFDKIIMDLFEFPKEPIINANEQYFIGDGNSQNLSKNITTVSKSYSDAVLEVKAKIKLDDFNNICSVCENRGIVYLPKKDGTIGQTTVTCPKCKGQSIHNKVIKQTVVNSSEKLEELIPNIKYRKTNFDSSELLRKIPISQDLKDKIVVTDYIELLDSLLLDFKNGKLPKSTYLLSAPDGFGKKHFAYQSIKELVSYGLNPSPLIDFLELENLFYNNKIAEFNEKIKYDILFIDILKRSGVETYKYLLNYCDREGIPIIFISRMEKASIITYKNGEPNFEWFDIFTDNSIDYEYSYIKNVGIYGFSANEVYNYKLSSLKEFMRNSPISQKSGTYDRDISKIDNTNLLITKDEIKNNREIIKPTISDINSIDM